MTRGPTNTGSTSTARAIERYFNIALYVLVLMGFGSLASTGGLDAPAVVLVSGALLLRGYHLLSRREFVIPETWTNYLTFIYIAIYFADYFFLSRSFLGASVHLVLFLLVVRLFSLQRPRDHYLLAALSFVMVLAAAVLTVGSVFLFSFAAFLLIAVVTFVLMEMRHSIASERMSAADPHAETAKNPFTQQMAHSLLAIAPVLMLMILVGSFLIFFLLPRISSRYLSAYTPTSDISTGFTDRVQLGRIGQIQQSSTVVMHIAIENDLQGVYDLKWRGVALSNFDGKTWSNSFEQFQLRQGLGDKYHLAAQESSSVATSASRLIRYRVTMEPLGTNVFFLAEQPYTLIGNYRPVSTDVGGAVYNLDTDHSIGRYSGESQLLVVDSDRLALTANTAPAELEPYLELPPLDPRIAKLAKDVSVDAPNNYEKALALERYLAINFGYTLELPRNLTKDPIANFLFERKKGHCEYFASAMAVMLRSLHIPSRVVTGFRGGEFNDLTGQYVVRASDAHSWVEAFFPGYGWISFDPTPAATASTHTGWSRMQLYLDAAASFWREWIINYDTGHQRQLSRNATTSSRQFFDDARRWVAMKHLAMLRTARRVHRQIALFPLRWLGGIAGFFVVLFTLANLKNLVTRIRARMLRSHPERAPRESASLWYERMVKRMARLGWRKVPAQTPQDFVAAIREEELREKVACFTRAYESARFGQSVEDAQKLPDLYEEIETGSRSRR